MYVSQRILSGSVPTKAIHLSPNDQCFNILQEEAVTLLGIRKGKWPFYHPAMPTMG